MYANVQQMVEAYKPTPEDILQKDEEPAKPLNEEGKKPKELPIGKSEEPVEADYENKQVSVNKPVVYSPPAAAGRAAQSFCNVSGMQLQATREESSEAEKEEKE